MDRVEQYLMEVVAELKLKPIVEECVLVKLEKLRLLSIDDVISFNIIKKDGEWFVVEPINEEESSEYIGSPYYICLAFLKTGEVLKFIYIIKTQEP